MNRKIKFQAFINETKQILPVASIWWKDDGTICSVAVRDIDGELETFFEGFVLLEFTGLKDKNEKEIYEGDIVEMTNPNYSVSAGFRPVSKGDKRVVKMLNGGFMLCYDWYVGIPNISGQVRNEDFSNWYMLFEVIGNVFQNPELLK